MSLGAASEVEPAAAAAIRGRVFDIQRFSVQDGPGIRTTVFMKGCPLACPWCSNPESQKTPRELGYIESLCDGCGRCPEACEPKAISLANGGVKIDRERCDDCGHCVEVCAPGALKLFGREISVEETFEEVKKDALYYRNSKGGVTASGGEPLQQSRFVAELFRRCHVAGIHTTLDTCGYAARPALERVLEHTDLVLYDLKLIDAEAHSAVVKAPNDPILENAERVAGSGVPMIVRIPLIPGLTETDENLESIARFVAELGPGVRAVNVLPYHRFGTSKYQMLDRPYELGELKPPGEERLEAIVAVFGSLGLDCEIVT
jgi:pyruvate formate lyase activating enzyme